MLQRKRERDYTTTTETVWGGTDGFDLLRGWKKKKFNGENEENNKKNWNKMLAQLKEEHLWFICRLKFCFVTITIIEP